METDGGVVYKGMVLDHKWRLASGFRGAGEGRENGDGSGKFVTRRLRKEGEGGGKVGRVGGVVVAGIGRVGGNGKGREGDVEGDVVGGGGRDGGDEVQSRGVLRGRWDIWEDLFL